MTKVLLFIATIAAMSLGSAAAAFANTTPSPATRILQSQVPRDVIKAFAASFSIKGDVMTAGKGACEPRAQYTKLLGWFREQLPITEADQLNGIRSSTIYEFRARFERDDILRNTDWKPIEQNFFQRGGAPFAVSYKERSSGNQLQSAVPCL